MMSFCDGTSAHLGRNPPLGASLRHRFSIPIDAVGPKNGRGRARGWELWGPFAMAVRKSRWLRDKAFFPHGQNFGADGANLSVGSAVRYVSP